MTLAEKLSLGVLAWAVSLAISSFWAIVQVAG